jgi:hypothetical protein
MRARVRIPGAAAPLAHLGGAATPRTHLGCAATRRSHLSRFVARPCHEASLRGGAGAARAGPDPGGHHHAATRSLWTWSGRHGNCRGWRRPAPVALQGAAFTFGLAYSIAAIILLLLVLSGREARGSMRAVA